MRQHYINRARQEVTQAAWLAEAQARRQAAEQTPEAAERAQRQAEEQARRQAEEQARRQPKEQARQLAEVKARQLAEVQAWRKAEEQARRQSKEQVRQGAKERARRQEKRRQQPPYQPAPQQQLPYQPPDGTQARPAQGKPSAAWATLVLLFGIFGILWGITSILAVIFGHRVLRKINAQPARGPGASHGGSDLGLGLPRSCCCWPYCPHCRGLVPRGVQDRRPVG
jgi:hypothetical protein